jgi:hypothetical protein
MKKETKINLIKNNFNLKLILKLKNLMHKIIKIIEQILMKMFNLKWILKINNNKTNKIKIKNKKVTYEKFKKAILLKNILWIKKKKKNIYLFSDV